MALVAASCHTLTAEIGKRILDKLQFGNSLESFFTTDTTVKTDRVHFVSTTPQYFYKWPIVRHKEYVCGHGRRHEEERTMKAGPVWNNKGNEELKKETENYHTSGKSSLWRKFEQRGVARSRECCIKNGQQHLNKIKVALSYLGKTADAWSSAEESAFQLYISRLSRDTRRSFCALRMVKLWKRAS